MKRSREHEDDLAYDFHEREGPTDLPRGPEQQEGRCSKVRSPRHAENIQYRPHGVYGVPRSLEGMVPELGGNNIRSSCIIRHTRGLEVWIEFSG